MVGHVFAEELEVSLRTVYRDIAELQMQGVPIRGEAGVGYVLEEGYEMPPLMLTADELEAAVLGAQWVARRGDEALRRGALDLLAKIAEVVPDHLRPAVRASGLSVPPSARPEVDRIDVARLREWMRLQRKVEIAYQKTPEGPVDTRVIWPFTLGYFDTVSVIVAWCELREDFRHFRTDRVVNATFLEERYPERPEVLRAGWWEQERARGERGGG